MPRKPPVAKPVEGLKIRAYDKPGWWLDVAAQLAGELLKAVQVGDEKQVNVIGKASRALSVLGQMARRFVDTGDLEKQIDALEAQVKTIISSRRHGTRLDGQGEGPSEPTRSTAPVH